MDERSPPAVRTPDTIRATSAAPSGLLLPPVRPWLTYLPRGVTAAIDEAQGHARK